jgi:hypothetical protein
VTTLTAALIDLHEAGITGEAALAVIRTAAQADPTLEESSTIVAAIIDVVEAGVPIEQGMALLALQHDAALGLEPGAFLEEVTTLMAALIDLHEAGITGEAALAVIRTAAQADPTLQEMDKVVEAVIELTTEQGLSPEHALAKVQAALAADPTLERLEEILGIEFDEQTDVDEERGQVNDGDVDEEEPGERPPAGQQGEDEKPANAGGQSPAEQKEEGSEDTNG